MGKNLIAAIVVSALCVLQASAQNLVENPSFEDPTVDTGSANDVWFRFGSGAQRHIIGEHCDAANGFATHRDAD